MAPIMELVWTFLFAGLLLVTLHLIPWLQILPRPVEPPWTYIWGIVSLSVCYALLLAWWQVDGRIYAPWVYLLAWGLTVIAGGGAIVTCYAFDAATERWACTKDERIKQEIEEGWGNEKPEGQME